MSFKFWSAYLFFVWLLPLTGILNNESWLGITGTGLLSYRKVGSQNNQLPVSYMKPTQSCWSCKTITFHIIPYEWWFISHFNSLWLKTINMSSFINGYFFITLPTNCGLWNCAAVFRLESEAGALQQVWVWMLFARWLLSRLWSEVWKRDEQNTWHPLSGWLHSWLVRFRPHVGNALKANHILKIV